MQETASQISAGAKIEIDKTPYLVISNDFSKPGKGQAFNTMRLKNFLNGRIIEKNFKSTERLQLADIEELDLRLLYCEQDSAVFMNDQNFDQLSIPFSVIGEKKGWLKDDTCYKIIFYDSAPIEIVPPIFLNLKVTQSETAARGNTVGAVMKKVIVETGVEIEVPGFIETGDLIKVDTRTGSYSARLR